MYPLKPSQELTYSIVQQLKIQANPPNNYLPLYSAHLADFVRMSRIEDMEEKIARFSRPKGYGVVPVLIHFGGVSDAVHDKRYFYRIIDINDFLE